MASPPTSPPRHSPKAWPLPPGKLTLKLGPRSSWVLFLGLCFNLILAPRVYALATDTLSRSQSYALGLLGLGVLGLSIYLFVVMFQPERF
jgi:K+-transporting ATPase KdpF subunit